MINKIKKLSTNIKEIILLFNNPVIVTLPPQMAYFLLLSLIPAIYLIGFFTGLFRIDQQTVLNYLTEYMIEDLAVVISEFLVPRSGEYLSIIGFLLFSLYLSSRFMHSVLRSSDIVYDVDETRNWVRARGLSMLLMLALIFLILFLVMIPIIGDSAISILENNGYLPPYLDVLWDISKFPISIIVMFFGLQFLYHFAPNTKVNRDDTRLGAFIASTGWIVTSFGYSFYLNNFSNYSVVYKAFSSVIILILYFYLISYIFVIGLVVNAWVHNKKHKNRYPVEKKYEGFEWSDIY